MTRKSIFSAIFSTRKTRSCWREIARFQAVRKQRIYEMVAAHQRNGRAAEGRRRFLRWRIANHPVGRTLPARWSRQASSRNLDEAFERFLKKGRPAVGAQGKNVRAAKALTDPSGGRARRHGASGLEPHRRHHSRRWWMPGWTASNVFTPNIPPPWLNVTWRSRINFICLSPAALTATVSARPGRSSAR